MLRRTQLLAPTGHKRNQLTSTNLGPALPAVRSRVALQLRCSARVQQSWGGRLEERVSASTSLPPTVSVTAVASAAFALSNMDKVVMSLAILPMAEQFGWSPSVSGLVQSSFFIGYLCCNVPGGLLVTRSGGWRMLPLGVGLWSAATAAAPLASASITSLCLTRMLVGAGEAIAPTSITDMLARVVPKEERASAVSLAFAGLNVGSIASMLSAPLIIEQWGWPALFYLYGALGLVWMVAFQMLLSDIGENDPAAMNKLTRNTQPLPWGAGGGGDSSKAGTGAAGQLSRSNSLQSTGANAASRAAPRSRRGESGKAASAAGGAPYRAFLRNPSLAALAATHFANNVFHYTLLCWLPTVMRDMLGLDLAGAASYSLVPTVAAMAAAVVAGPIADRLIAQGQPVPLVRKGAQAIAFLVPSACLAALIALAPLTPSYMTSLPRVDPHSYAPPPKAAAAAAATPAVQSPEIQTPAAAPAAAAALQEQLVTRPTVASAPELASTQASTPSAVTASQSAAVMAPQGSQQGTPDSSALDASSALSLMQAESSSQGAEDAGAGQLQSQASLYSNTFAAAAQPADAAADSVAGEQGGDLGGASPQTASPGPLATTADSLSVQASSQVQPTPATINQPSTPAPQQQPPVTAAVQEEGTASSTQQAVAVQKKDPAVLNVGPLAVPVPALNVALLTVALGFSSFSLAGLYCSHQDLSTKYAGALLGITNTAGAISGLVSVAATGALLDATQGSWALALYLPNLIALTLGTAAYTLGARLEPVDFDAADNSPFGFEKHLARPLAVAESVAGTVGQGLKTAGSAVSGITEAVKQQSSGAVDGLLGSSSAAASSSTSTSAIRKAEGPASSQAALSASSLGGVVLLGGDGEESSGEEEGAIEGLGVMIIDRPRVSGGGSSEGVWGPCSLVLPAYLQGDRVLDSIWGEEPRTSVWAARRSRMLVGHLCIGSLCHDEFDTATSSSSSGSSDDWEAEEQAWAQEVAEAEAAVEEYKKSVQQSSMDEAQQQK